MVVWKLVRFTRVEGESAGAAEMKKFAMDMNVTSMKAQDGDLRIDFTYRMDYSKEVGFLVMRGYVLAEGARKEIDDVLAGWKKKKLPEEFATQLSDVIVYNCEVNGVLVSRVLAIPAPVIPPKFSVSQATG